MILLFCKQLEIVDIYNMLSDVCTKVKFLLATNACSVLYSLISQTPQSELGQCICGENMDELSLHPDNTDFLGAKAHLGLAHVKKKKRRNEKVSEKYELV